MQAAQTIQRTPQRIRAEVVAGGVDARWMFVQHELADMNEAVIGALGAAILPAGQRVPSRRALVTAVRRRRAALEESLEGARSVFDLELWPADVLADGPHHDLSALAKARARLLAALAAWNHLNLLDREAAHAPSRMDALRQRKGA